MRWLFPLIFVLGACATEAKKTSGVSINIDVKNCLPIQYMNRTLLDEEYKIISSAKMTVNSEGKDVVSVLTYIRSDGYWITVAIAENGVGCLILWGDKFKMFHDDEANQDAI